MATKPKRPRDANQLAKFITDLATGEVDLPKTDDGKDPAAVALGRKGGFKVPGKYTVRPLRQSRGSVFSKSDIECIDRSIAAHGGKSFGQLADESHDAAWHATLEGQEMALIAIVKMMANPDEIIQHLEIADEQAA